MTIYYLYSMWWTNGNLNCCICPSFCLYQQLKCMHIVTSFINNTTLKWHWRYRIQHSYILEYRHARVRVQTHTHSLCVSTVLLKLDLRYPHISCLGCKHLLSGICFKVLHVQTGRLHHTCTHPYKQQKQKIPGTWAPIHHFTKDILILS